MKGFPAGRWSGGGQLFWTGGKPGDRLEIAVPVAEAGDYNLEIVFTQASDYAIVKLSLGEQVLAEKLDLYNYPDVITSGVLTYKQSLAAGKAKLVIEIVGASPSAAPGRLVGVDYVRLVKAP
jgi:hypothetical protein